MTIQYAHTLKGFKGFFLGSLVRAHYGPPTLALWADLQLLRQQLCYAGARFGVFRVVGLLGTHLGHLAEQDLADSFIRLFVYDLYIIIYINDYYVRT